LPSDLTWGSKRQADLQDLAQGSGRPPTEAGIGGFLAPVAFPSVSDATDLTRRHVWIAGRVQGVWFRETCRRQADALGVAGWVRNRRDGRVEAVFEGPATAVASMVEWCRSGPPRAEVTAIEVIDEPVAGDSRFDVC
jgi:acylphosphatase